MPSLLRVFFSACFCRRRYKVYMKQHNKASEKVENDFDLLRIIKLIREHSIALRSLLDMP